MNNMIREELKIQKHDGIDFEQLLVQVVISIIFQDEKSYYSSKKSNPSYISIYVIHTIFIFLNN